MGLRMRSMTRYSMRLGRRRARRLRDRELRNLGRKVPVELFAFPETCYLALEMRTARKLFSLRAARWTVWD